MEPSPHVDVRIDLARVRANAVGVRQLVGPGVDLLAVVKADAYGLGAARVIAAVDELVDGYCFFQLREAHACAARDLTARTILTLGPPGDASSDDFRSLGVRPAVASVDDALRLRAADPVLVVDTGQQRFACPPGHITAALEAGGCREAMTHASSAAQARQLLDLTAGRGLRLHAAGTSLLADPAARLDAVRPGLAMYRGAVRVTTRLVDVRDSTGPAGYTGFTVPRHGVVLAGYSSGLRPGPCTVNGRPSRVLEVGMQSAFVECSAGDRAGDEVVLLGDGVTEDAVAAAWGTPPQAVLVALAACGARRYAE